MTLMIADPDPNPLLTLTNPNSKYRLSRAVVFIIMQALGTEMTYNVLSGMLNSTHSHGSHV